MPSKSAMTSDRDDQPLAPSDGDRVSAVSPASSGRSAYISTAPDVPDLPAPWLDGLLTLGHELPFGQGPGPVTAALVAGLERIVPALRVAIRQDPGGVPRDRGSGHGHVLWTEPPKSDERVRSSRVFPDAAHERSVALPGPLVGGVLHFAADDGVISSDGSPHVQLMERAAVVVSHALARARMEERSAALEAQLHTAEAQAVQAEKLASFGQIAAGMVHELNNPLTSIAAYTDFLLRRAASRGGVDADDVERLRRIAESADRMLRFTRDLVAYARPSGDVPIAVQLNTVIDRALAFCEHEISGAGVVVERSFDVELEPVRGLPEQLAQVFVNLVTNACHAMAKPRDARELPPGAPRPDGLAHLDRPPVLTLSTSRVLDEASGLPRVTVVVQDTGCGIASQNLALIFKPFFTTKDAGRGTGLGLSIVRSIVEGHAGQIRAESDPSVGTRFVLSFPALSDGSPTDGGAGR